MEKLDKGAKNKKNRYIKFGGVQNLLLENLILHSTHNTCDEEWALGARCSAL